MGKSQCCTTFRERAVLSCIKFSRDAHFAIIVIFILFSTRLSIAQDLIDWRSEAASGDWEWGVSCDGSGPNDHWYNNTISANRFRPDCYTSNIIYFKNNNQTVMNLNSLTDYSANCIIFDINPGNRTINSNTAPTRSLYLKQSSGNAKIENLAAGTIQTFNVNVNAEGSSTWLEIKPANGNLVFNNPVVNNSNNPIHIWGNQQVTFNGDIIGTPGITVNGNATTVLSGNDKTYTGTTTINNGGFLSVSSNQTLNDVVLNAGGTLRVEAGVTLNLAGNWTGGGTIDNRGTIILSGPAVFPGNSTTISRMVNLVINRLGGVILDKSVSVSGIITLTSGILNSNGFFIQADNQSPAAVSGGGPGSYVNGNLRRAIGAGINSYLFPIGDATAYTPVTMNFASGTNPGVLEGKTTAGDHGFIGSSKLYGSRSVNRTWTFTTISGLPNLLYSATFVWVPGDQDPGFDYNKAIAGKYSTSAWSYPVIGSRTANSIYLTGMSGFSDFQIAEDCTPDLQGLSASPNPVCSSSPATISIVSGSLNGADHWQWYTGSCGGTAAGTGSSITVSPASSTTYWVRGEGGCAPVGGPCSSITLTVNQLPAITLGLNPAVCAGITSASLSYSSTLNNPDQYSIDYDAAAEAAGFIDVTTAPLPANPIILMIPAGTAPGVYLANLTVKNSTTGCTSIAYPISITVKPIPDVAAAPVNQSVCPGTAIAQILITNPNGVAGTVFSWSRTNTVILTGIPASGTGSTISGILNSSMPGTIQNTVFTITASAGGCSSSTTVIVSVGDVTQPVITCPVSGPQNVNTNSNCHYVHSGTGWDATASDNCVQVSLSYTLSGATTGSGSTLDNVTFNLGTTTVTWTAVDAAGNKAQCSFTVVVSDIQPPVITCPVPASSYPTTPGLCVSKQVFTATATDNCGMQSIRYYIGAAEITFPYGFPVGSTMVTVRATDIYGNIAICSFTVVVVDNETPVITCPVPAASYPTDPGACSAALSFTATATDNCSIQSVRYFVGAAEITFPYQFPKGTTVVTAVAADLSGNTVPCSFSVVVTDTEPPAIACPSSPQNRNTGSGGCNYTVIGTEFDPLAFNDNCPGFTISNNYNFLSTLNGAVFPAGSTLVTWTVTAANGYRQECSFTVTVSDNQAPAFSNCPSDITVFTGPGRTTCDQSATWTPPTVNDNCGGGVTVTSNYLPGATFPVGVTSVVYTATDPAGNTATCTFTVTVTDNTPPTFTVPANVNIYANGGCVYNASVAVTGDVTNEWDNCSPTGLNAVYTDTWTNGVCAGLGIITRTWVLTDIHGNSTTKVQTITVLDQNKPGLIVPPNRNIQCHESILPANTGQATASDNCGGSVTVTYTDNSVPGSCPSESTLTRTWTAVDCSGNTSTEIQVIILMDNTSPTGSAALTIVPCPKDIPAPNINVVTASDNCGSVTVTFEDEIPYGLEGMPGYCPDSIYRIYKVADQCGNFCNVTHRIIVTSHCNCSPCATKNAFFTVDLEGQPNGDTTIYNVERLDKCCDATKEQCASFNVRIDEDAVGVRILIDGATPSPQDWRIDCESVVIHGDVICVPGGAFHLFTYCKPGANLNNFTFESVAGVVLIDEILTRVACEMQINVEDTTLSNPVWNSVWPGTVGQYNNYLSCTDCLNPVFIPDANAPPEIHYQVCGDLQDTVCNTAFGIGCDTVIVHVLDSIHVEFNVDPGAFCQDNFPEIIATVTPFDDYQLTWYDAYNGPYGTGSQVGSGYSFTPTHTGEHSLVVNALDQGVPCSEYIYNFWVAPDEDPPVITPPPPLVLECNDPGNAQAINDWLQLAYAVDDNTLNPPVVHDYTGITQYCGSSVTVTFSSTDECFNTGNATSTISIIDTLAPFWITAPGALDRTNECSDLAGIAASQSLSPVAGDQCDISLTVVKTSGPFIPFVDCPQAGIYTNTWTATDDCGNVSAIYTQVITLLDYSPPVFTSPAGSLNRSLYCNDAAGLAAAQSLVPAVYDLCDANLVPVKTAGPFIPGSCPNSGTYTNTWVVTDDCGNSSLPFTQVITIYDNVAPVIGTQAASLTVECDGAGNTIQLNNWLVSNGGAQATDDCGAVTWTNNFIALSPLCGGTGSATVTFTATDACNNTSSTTATFTITDTQPPVISCPLDVIAQVDPDDCVATNPVLGTPVFSDLCSGPVTISNNAPGIFPPGNTTVIWTATDACGNVATCNQLVTVEDPVPPSVNCPVNVTVDAEPGLCSATVTVPSPVVTDPCPYVITNSFNGSSNASGTYPVGVTTVTWTITGISGNITTCIQTVTVLDKQLPTITCPADQLFVAPPPDCQLMVTAIPDPQLGDNCGTASLTLAWVMTGATSGSGTGSINGTTFNVGETTVTYTVTDSGGNQASCQFTVVVNDLVPPTILACPPDITVTVPNGVCSLYIDVPEPDIEDPCNEIFSVTNSYNGTGNASGTYPVGITTVIWTITDFSGNVSTCTQIVTVLDSEAPTITCPPNQEQQILDGGCSLSNVILPNPVINDNCTVASLTWVMSGATTGSSPASGINYVTGQTFNVGITTVTYTVTDPSGNQASCSFNVWIKNLNAPQFQANCPADVSGTADPDECHAYVNVPAPEIINPCAEAYTIINNSPYGDGQGSASGTYPVGVTVVTWTITDASGNMKSCSQSVTVNDLQAPKIVCPGDQVQQITNGGCTLEDVNIPNPAFNDNCSVVTLTWAMTGATAGSSPLTGINYVSGQTFNVGITTVTYTVTDPSGNQASCSFNVWIKNLTAPQFQANCPADVSETVDPGGCHAFVNVPAPEIINPCNEAYTVVNNSPYRTSPADASGTYPAGTTIVTWTITDASGNITTCNQSVTVTDLQAPWITCPDDQEQEITNGGCTLEDVIVPDPTFGDNCSVETLTWTMSGATTGSSPLTGINFVSGETFNVGITTVTYVVADSTGNTDTCSFQVWIKNLNAPQFQVICPGNVTQPADPDECHAYVNVPPPVIINPCNEAYTVTNNSPYGDGLGSASGTYPIGTTTVNWTVADASGNVYPCIQQVTVTDLPPSLTCPPSIIVDADYEKNYASGVNIGVPVFSDNCGNLTLTWVSSMPTPGNSPPTGINIDTTSIFYVGVTTITYTLTDSSGLSVSCSFTVTVLSEPVITCPGDIVANNDPGLCSAFLDPGQPVLVSGVQPITWNWWMTGATTASGTGPAVSPNPFPFNVGVTTITWVASNISGSDTCSHTVTVIDNEPPTFLLPPDSTYCVNNLFVAIFNPNPTPGIIPEYDDITVPRPEYYIFPAGSTQFDLDPVLNNLNDNCCPDDSLIIHWRIVFSPTPNPATAIHEPVLQPPIPPQTGQPSLYGEIHFPGDGVYFTDTEHYIYYWLEDCNGNVSAEEMLTITIIPRPNVIKQ